MSTNNNKRLTFGTELDKTLATLEDEELFHMTRLTEIRQDKETVIHAGHLSMRQETGMMHDGRGNGYGIHSHIKPTDIAHARRIWDAYIEIALRSNGFLHVRSAARLIMASRLTTTPNPDHFVNVVYRTLKDSYDFVLYSPGTFRYTPFPDWGHAQPDRRPKQEPVSTVNMPASPYWQKNVRDGDPNG